MDNPAFQDLYPDDLAHCYGCGRHNAQGHQLKSYWARVGEETVAHFTPAPYHTAIPGYVYGGLIASLIDCHGTGTAAAFARLRDPAGPPPRFVTAALKVDFLAPTPLGVALELRGVALEVKDKKVVVAITVSAHGQVTAKGEVVAVRMPASMAPPAQ